MFRLFLLIRANRWATSSARSTPSARSTTYSARLATFSARSTSSARLACLSPSAARWTTSSLTCSATTSTRSTRYCASFCPFLFVLFPSFFVLCINTCTTMAVELDLKAAAHLLERSVRDINYGNNGTGVYNDDATVQQQQSQQQQQGAGISIASFLGNLSPSTRVQLSAIANSPNMTKEQTNEALDELAQRQGQPFYTVYLGLKSAYESARQQLDQQHAALMQNQSQAVQEADAKLQTIVNNQFITPTEEQQQMADQMAQFPSVVQQALVELAPYPSSSKK